MFDIPYSFPDDDLAATDDRKLTDLVDALCQAALPDERAHLAAQLKNAVDNASDVVTSNLRPSFEIDHGFERGPAVAALTFRLHTMLTSGNVRHRLAAIEAFTALISTETESMHARTQRTSNAIRVLFSTNMTDIATAAAAAKLVGAFSQLNSPMSARAVNYALNNALSLIINPRKESPHPQLSMDRARAAMVITELAEKDKVQNLIFVREGVKLRKDMWYVCWDEDREVGKQGVRALQAIITATVNHAKKQAGERAMHDTMDTIRNALSDRRDLNALPKCPDTVGKVSMVHGSLCMLGSLLNVEATKVFMHAFSEELCDLVLPFQTCSEHQLRQAVADILPLLVELDRIRFANRFLHSVHASTLKLIRNEKFPSDERGQSLISLSAIAEQMPRNDNCPMLSDLLKVCRDALCAPFKLTLPQSAVITTISYLARASRGSPVFERAVKDGMLTIVFNTDFTNDLVNAVDEIGNAVPTFTEPIRLRLVHLIAATLKKRLPSRRDGLTGHSPVSSVEDDLGGAPQSPIANSSVARTRSLLSLGQGGTNSSFPVGSRNGTSTSGVGPQRNLGEGGLKKWGEPSARDFFRQVPISTDLHRIDSSSILASRPSAQSLDGAMKGDLMTSSSEQGNLNLFGGEKSTFNDRENSPCVALKAIINFDFSDMLVQDFISLATEFVIGYVEYNSVKVRALAVAASAKLMLSAATLWEGPSGGRRRPQQLRRGIHDILDQILSIAVADPSTDVRFVAIRSLHEPVFWPYLLQATALRKLFLCFHDSSLAMRDSAISLAGQFCIENPAKILPVLRNYLMHLLTVLRCDGDFFERDRREATELIYTLVHNCSNLIVPYTTSLMDAVLARLREVQRLNDTSSALPVLLALAEMGGMMSQIDLGRYEVELIPLLISSFLEAQAAGSNYKKAVIRALTAFVQNTSLSINPYMVHKSLLSELLQLLTSETDSSVRILAGILLGSLGAVDPADNKYAAIIDYAGRRQNRSKNRLPGNISQSQSVFKPENTVLSSAFQIGASAPKFAPQNQDVIMKSLQVQMDIRARKAKGGSGGNTSTKFRQTEPHKMKPIDRPRIGEDRLESMSGGPGPKENAEMSLSLLSLGGRRLSELVAQYCPCWALDEIPKDSLMGLLEHPFTANADFFPSAALDILHKIIATPRLRDHHREACQAIVGILKSVRPKCVNFLSAVVPRVLWLLAQSSAKEPRHGSSFTQLQHHIMHRIADIIVTAGHSYMPFAFDTVLIVWRYLETANISVACVTSCCTVLSRLRAAIGDEFKPVIATVLPSLLSALAEDTTGNGVAPSAVLRTLESFGSLLEEYHILVLISIARVVINSQVFVIREQALTALIRILKEMQSVEIISSVIHPLLLVLSGADGKANFQNEETFEQELSKQTRIDLRSQEKLAVLAASALTELGKRTGTGFDVFVPVVAKSLKASDVAMTNRVVYRDLKSVLMSTDPDVVGELLSEDEDSLERNQPFALNNNDDTSQPDDLEEGSVSSPIRGGSFRGQPTLPLGTRTAQPRAHVVEEALVNKWEISHNFTAQDWNMWFESVGATMFEQSGSPAFRACGRISDSYPQFTRQLFNAAFLSCWTAQLTDHTRNKICSALESALTSETIPLNVLQGILNLFEFMDHDEKPLPCGTDRLASTAFRCGAFAKAIRYREHDYAQHIGKPDLMKEDVCGDHGLIAIYEKVGQVESAIGAISHFQEHSRETLQEEWFEKLQKWDDALTAYQKTETYILADSAPPPDGLTRGEALFGEKKSWDHLLGRLRCLNQLGEWREMNVILRTAKEACDGNFSAMSQLALEGKGTSVAFDLEQWGEFEEWVSYIPPDTYDGCFYNTLLRIRHGQKFPDFLSDAQTFLDKARVVLDLELTARVSEGYPRAYTHVVNAQVLVELEEMIDYLRLSPSLEQGFGKQRMQDIWAERLKGCKQDWYTWYRLLMVRALVLKPVENKDQWLEFATMCRKTNRLPMASEALRMLVMSCEDGFPGIQSDMVSQGNGLHTETQADVWSSSAILHIKDLDVKFACIKHLWGIEKRFEAYHSLRECCHEYWPASDSTNALGHGHDVLVEENTDGARVLAGEVFSKLSKWGDRLLESVGNNETDPTGAQILSEDPLGYAERATQIRPDWYKAWHYWGVLNISRFDKLMSRAAVRLNTKKNPSLKPWHFARDIMEILPGGAGRTYLTRGIQGYFRAIDLEGKTRLEDTLKVLTLWFNYGGHANLYSEFDKYFKVTNIAMWLEVVPQIIARLFSCFPGIQRGVRALLTRIGKEHPQIAVYPLTVARSAQGDGHSDRRRIAGEILDDLKRFHPEVIEQSQMVAGELVRAAILWSEMWHERLEEASKLYFVERNVEGFLDVMLPLHDEFDKGPETISECEFVKEYGEEIRTAGNLCRRFHIEHKNGGDQDVLGQYLVQAWNLYHVVFKKIQRYQPSMLLFDTGYVSKRLKEASNLVLSVPGTYDPSRSTQVIGIQGFGPQLHVVQSKQRPRKVAVLGSDGRTYQFLLKGHEDLRQDERVMQVFGLINKLFAKSVCKDILSGAEMKQYAVIALSANAGLIGWVPDCDTLHSLVKEYREVRSIMPNVEHKVMLRFAPEPDRLPLLHKVDLFEFMLQNTSSFDIQNVLWLRSRNSEMWLDIRNTYARSLATTSMTGYLLGLGDRHPSNVMIERATGKVLHIDFGDCFEVAMKREKYPEKVPFRLTRMLVQALEPCGVDGYFKHTAEATMEVLRQQNARESLMAVMEAFAYDPLIRWKLIGATELEELRGEQAEAEYKRNVLSGSSSRLPPQPASFSHFRAGPGMQELVRSIQETGSFADSVVRRRRHEELMIVAAAGESPGRTITTSSQSNFLLHEDEDGKPANLLALNRIAGSEQMGILAEGDDNVERLSEVSNVKAQLALNRFEDKLRGTDFGPQHLHVKKQVALLIREARSIENLCALFMGWCAFW